MFYGEISLTGDIRTSPQSELRLKEAAKLGFTTAVVPRDTKANIPGLRLKPVKDVGDLIAFAGAAQKT